MFNFLGTYCIKSSSKIKVKIYAVSGKKQKHSTIKIKYNLICSEEENNTNVHYSLTKFQNYRKCNIHIYKSNKLVMLSKLKREI